MRGRGGGSEGQTRRLEVDSRAALCPHGALLPIIEGRLNRRVPPRSAPPRVQPELFWDPEIGGLNEMTDPLGPESTFVPRSQFTLPKLEGMLRGTSNA